MSITIYIARYYNRTYTYWVLFIYCFCLRWYERMSAYSPSRSVPKIYLTYVYITTDTAIDTISYDSTYPSDIAISHSLNLSIFITLFYTTCLYTIIHRRLSIARVASSTSPWRPRTPTTPLESWTTSLHLMYVYGVLLWPLAPYLVSTRICMIFVHLCVLTCMCYTFWHVSLYLRGWWVYILYYVYINRVFLYRHLRLGQSAGAGAGRGLPPRTRVEQRRYVGYMYTVHNTVHAGFDVISITAYIICTMILCPFTAPNIYTLSYHPPPV